MATITAGGQGDTSPDQEGADLIDECRSIARGFEDVLTVIFGNLEMLEAYLEGEEERSLLRAAGAAAERGARLTERLLARVRAARCQT